MPPRWPASVPVAPVSSGGNEEESTEYNQMVSGFGGMNPDEGMLEGWCQVYNQLSCCF